MKLLTWAISFALAAAIASAAVFAIGGMRLATMITFGPAEAQAQREITVQSMSFIQSTNSAAAGLIAAYNGLETDALKATQDGSIPLAESYNSQRRALALQICTMVEPLSQENYSQAVRSFVSSGGCSAR